MTSVIAHRTCPRHAPENSLEGISQAARLGADAVEMDVRVTADGVPVLLHDSLLLRAARLPVPVRALSMTTLRRLVGEVRVPRLEDALLAAAANGLRAVLDVKAAGAAPAVLALVDSLPAQPVSLWSQHEVAVARFVATGGDAGDIALLRDTSSGPDREQLLRDAERLGAGGVSAHWSVVDRGFLRRATDAGLRVYSWCQWPHRHAEKAGFGLAGVVTDWPDLARQAGL